MAEVYCGPPVTPGVLYMAWNLDQVAVALCLALAGLHIVGGRGKPIPLYLAVGLIAVLFISPLCALTASLFSIRVLHHVALVAVVAPLLALAFPAGGAARLPIQLLVGVHAVVVWLWHVPDVYAAAIGPAALYWTMQASLLLTGFLLWRRILAPTTNTGTAILALLATATQMGMLGALLTFSPAPLYAAHFLTTEPFGISPLEDQQLAGLLMWVPAALPYLMAALFILFSRLGDNSPAGRAGKP